MKKLIIFLVLSVLLVIFLSGCGTVPPREVVTDIKLVPIEIPKPLLKKCKATPPIPPDEYINMKAEKKEEALTDLNIKLYTDIKNCNEQIEGINKYQTNQLEIIKGKNK
jgi:uncharacterized lipoprotein YehR (DUF1307 family)